MKNIEIKYENTLIATFLKRNNRFTADVMIEEQVETVHVKNTGRLKELLLPNTKVMLQKASNPARTTLYDLICVYSDLLGWVNVDSLVPNMLMKKYLEQRYDLVKPEYTYGDSRFDFYMEKDGERYLTEVKGCTQTDASNSGIGYFPDAPTLRGVKHLRELSKAVKEGYHCSIDFVIQMNGIKKVLPNIQIQPEFGTALEEASKAGVKIMFHPCKVDEDSIRIIE